MNYSNISYNPQVTDNVITVSSKFDNPILLILVSMVNIWFLVSYRHSYKKSNYMHNKVTLEYVFDYIMENKGYYGALTLEFVNYFLIANVLYFNYFI